jgi:hypothetical protein
MSLDASSYSGIPPGLNKLEFEIEKISYHQMQGLWTSMGAKYIPSVIYQVRLISVQGNEAESITQAVRNTGTSLA